MLSNYSTSTMTSRNIGLSTSYFLMDFVLYYTVLYCHHLYCILLCCIFTSTVLYCIVTCTLLYSTFYYVHLYCTVLYCHLYCPPDVVTRGPPLSPWQESLPGLECWDHGSLVLSNRMMSGNKPDIRDQNTREPAGNRIKISDNDVTFTFLEKE